MTVFYSVLFPTEESAALPRRKTMPEFFADLQLDLILKRGLGEYRDSGLEEIYYTPVTDREVIRYRQEILREMEDPSVREALEAIVERFGTLREFMDGLREKLESGGRSGKYAPHVQGTPGAPKAFNDLSFLAPRKTPDWLDMGRVLEKLGQFTATLGDFAGNVRSLRFRSQGLQRFADYVADYCQSEEFREMDEEARRLRAAFNEVRYCLWFKSNNSAIRVLPYEEQEDYASRIEALFSRFRQGDVQDFRKHLEEAPVSEMLENEVLQLVSRRYPQLFKDLQAFCGKYLQFEDDTILRFAREARFYLGWLEMSGHLKEAGLAFCYPNLEDKPEETYVQDCFDLALALRKPEGVVTNSFSLTPPEQILIVTGPNQGGKSTFARSFGQVHYLASLGLTVPGRAASLPFCDGVLTHFEREEKLKDLNGKLRDDLVRLKKLLDAATPRSVIVVNEIFASTTAWDAQVLSGHMLEAITQKGGNAVVVTFLEELADFGPQTVSMAAEAPEKGKGEASFRILRKKPGGLSYAMRLAERHALSYEDVIRRVGG
jgi:hypothetical protein